MILTQGEQGSKIISKENIIDIKSFNYGKCIDTTGAGDSYAGGFLHAYTKNKSLEECGNLGSKCSGYIVTQLGARSEDLLKKIKK